MLVEFHPDAEVELIESALFYESRVGGPGYRFIREVEQPIRLLLNYPELGETHKGKFRHLVLEHFPYTLIYTVSAECLSVIAVAHQHKKPGYWHTRNNLQR